MLAGSLTSVNGRVLWLAVASMTPTLSGGVGVEAAYRYPRQSLTWTIPFISSYINHNAPLITPLSPSPTYTLSPCFSLVLTTHHTASRFNGLVVWQPT